MKPDIEIPSLQPSTNGTKHVKGIAHPKTLITNEIMMYFYGSVFLGFLVSSILSLLQVELITNSGFGFCTTILCFITLSKINNRYFNVDSKRVRDLVIANKFETLTALLLLERDVMKYIQHPETSNNLDTFLEQIFPNESVAKKDILLRCTDILRFMESIEPIDRERIYRYYLIRTIPQS
jgi:predicted ABC-type exoprotein transport system permease subunit